MESEAKDFESLDFHLVRGGFVNRIAKRFGLSSPSLRVRIQRILLLILVTFVPLVVLSIFSGHATSGFVDVPLFHDPAVFGRFLFVLPVLELAEAVVALSLPVQARHFLDSELVSKSDRPRFESAAREVVRFRSSAAMESSFAIFALVLSVFIRLFLMQNDNSSWEVQGSTRTLAGWWYVFVSAPILFFFLLRWLWIFLLWGWFLFRVSRINLKLTPTHPDHAGGLGFLGWGLASFATVILAMSAMFSCGFFYLILHGHESLDSLKYHVIVFVVIAIVVVHAPLLVFFHQMSRCRFRGLLDFSTLILEYDRQFEEKWLEKKGQASGETLLGSADIQSLADIGTVFEHVNDMQLIPFDLKGFGVLVAAAILPMLPLAATALPLNEILSKLAELMV